MAAPVAVNDTPARRFGGWRLVRLALVICGLAASMWLAGFLLFLYRASSPAPKPGHVDAIVVLTGGPDRVEVALRLLADGAANRLLVSGAGERTDVAALAHRAGLDPAPLESVVTLGRAAHTTRGNALETASWVHGRHIRTLLVVTTWFHMPRAMVELGRVMPDVTCERWPVGRLDIDELTRPGSVWRIVGEYHKYLAALVGLTASPTAIAIWGTEPVG